MATPTLDEAAIFNIARHMQAPEDRQQYLRDVCGTDLGMLARVESLLRIHEQELHFLESPVSTMRACLPTS